MKSPFLLSCALCAAAVQSVPADYRDDTGYNQLKAELGAAMLDGTGVDMTQVEAPVAPDAYLPQPGSGTFAGTGGYAGKMFTAKSGAGIYSFHASEVGGFMYYAPPLPDAVNGSMCPALVNVDCYNANNWDDEFLAPLPNRLDPAPEVRAVQNHAWVYDAANASEASAIRDLMRRQDFSINRDNYVCCVGVNNYVTNPVPDMMASAYNVISAGLTNGQHSRGGVTSDMDGPGRRKPEIVVPLGATSYATGYVSSAAGLLRQKANMIGTANAKNPRTIKAVLLAGATKDEFPGWSRTATDPIDAIYGAGELNIYNSYQIMNGGEQPIGTAGRPLMAWDYSSINPSGSAEYRLTIPAGSYGTELSVFLVWHRTPTDTNSSPSIFTLGNDAVANLDLALFRDPAVGPASSTPLDSSTSTIYNIEHIWRKNLTAGNYRFKVTRAAAAGSTHFYSIAWRVHTAPHLPQPVMTGSGDNFQFTFPDLLIGQPYKFQSSPNLTAWTDIESFTATSVSAVRLLAKPASPRVLYRLLPVLP